MPCDRGGIDGDDLLASGQSAQGRGAVAGGLPASLPGGLAGARVIGQQRGRAIAAGDDDTRAVQERGAAFAIHEVARLCLRQDVAPPEPRASGEVEAVQDASAAECVNARAVGGNGGRGARAVSAEWLGEKRLIRVTPQQRAGDDVITIHAFIRVALLLGHGAATRHGKAGPAFAGSLPPCLARRMRGPVGLPGGRGEDAVAARSHEGAHVGESGGDFGQVETGGFGLRCRSGGCGHRPAPGETRHGCAVGGAFVAQQQPARAPQRGTREQDERKSFQTPPPRSQRPPKAKQQHHQKTQQHHAQRARHMVRCQQPCGQRGGQEDDDDGEGE